MAARANYHLLLFFLLAWGTGMAAAAGLGLRFMDAPGGGVEVTQVAPDSPASRAGLEAGDFIREAGGRPVPGAAALVEILKRRGDSQAVPLIVERGGWRRQLSLAGDPDTSSVVQAGTPAAPPRLGIRVADGGTGEPAARVTAVDPGSPAANAGLAVGDLIHEAQGQVIGNAADFATLVRGLDGIAPLELRISRDGWRRTLRLVTGQRSPIAAVEPAATSAALVAPAAPLVQDPCAIGRIGTLPEFDCLLELGVLQLDAEKWEEAGRLFQQAIRLEPKRVEGWARMAELHDRKGDLPGAIESERRALAAVGENAWIYARISWYHHRLGQLDDARVSAERALALDGHNIGGQATLASLAIQQMDWEKAILHLRKFTQVKPDDASAWGDLGLALSGAGQDKEALTAFERSLALDSGHAATWFNAGLNLRRMGREQEGVAYLRRVAELDPQGELGRLALQQVAQPSGPQPPVSGSASDSAAARGDGRRASVAVGDFQVKAAKASQQIGDGLREMFLTSLHESGYFNVVERMDIQGLAAEQALSRSGMAGQGEAMPGGEMDVADIMVYGVVSEFEPEAGGMAYSSFMPQMGMSVRQSTKFSEMAIDVRAVEVRSGRVLVAQRIPGTAHAYSAGLGVRISSGGISMPVGLGAYRNTPMEWAIRDCIQKATYFVINQLPQDYFRHP
jgi:curli biogenesis system outer membrane secretion channel CsgG